MTATFHTLKVNDLLIQALEKQAITSPTPVQALTFPAFLEGKDLVVESHTGSGKTLAFLLPLFEKIDSHARATQAIILAPTHELVMQIHEQIKLLAKNSSLPISSCPIMGEVNIEKQIIKLRDKPHIIVGTAGRVLDLMMKKKINNSTIQTVVLDEADNLLDQNQANTIKKLLHLTSTSRQVCLFSASISAKTLETAKMLMPSPTIIKSAKQTTLNPRIQHFYIVGEKREKFDQLRKLLVATNTERALIFVSQNTDTQNLVEKLVHHGHTVATISGKLTKEERKTALTRFRLGKVKLLISSDLSARGLDIPDITHVIHFDMPLTPHDYLHRAGRSARGLKDGISICLTTPKDLGAIRIFERDFNITISPITLVKGQIKNLSTGQFLPATPVTKKANKQSASPAKSRNKYPKGFTSQNTGRKAKASTTSNPTKKKNFKLPEVPEQAGTLADALSLIANDKFGKNYE